MRTLVLRAVATVLTGVLAVAMGCTAPPPPPPALQPPAPMVTATAVAVEDAGSPEDAGTDAEAPAPRVVEAPPYVEPPGSTRGTIACGKGRCDASKEVCTLLEPDLRWTCHPRDQTEKLTNSILYCDDGTDCPWGKTCCRSFASASAFFVCTTRDVDCPIEVCIPGGARCPAGMVCSDRRCVPAKVPGARCGTKHCTGATPLCHWKNGKGECISAEKAQEIDVFADQSAVLRCTENADCGAGFHCCTGSAAGARQSYCSLNCDLVNSQQFCGTVADCPTMGTFKRSCVKPDVAITPWSKVCLFEP